ncbi:c-type cytochrome [Pasteurella multocida]|uniref:c-type cytochrome n=1 Tax=Pasteurella multocida TaxID=747 RepID=UPI000999BED3|nr:cytochrome c [Pasteurella multocida]ARA71207.1 cytochrome C biogenesis protein CcsB [Pasteurella multocida subsp. multocida]OPD01619.1 cytochrome C biogenesis protein CcsB [Pasteurella multocida subsp. septica]OPD07325.1 cytochrome C biogenesis protein CcsB [Pasteurella multocida subsp. septica]
MKKYDSALWILLALVPIAQANVSVKRGQQLFKPCSFCHGNQAEKSALNQSRPLKDLPENEIVNALKARKEGQIIGAGNAAKSRLSEEDMQSVAKFIETLK